MINSQPNIYHFDLSCWETRYIFKVELAADETWWRRLDFDVTILQLDRNSFNPYSFDLSASVSPLWKTYLSKELHSFLFQWTDISVEHCARHCEWCKLEPGSACPYRSSNITGTESAPCWCVAQEQNTCSLKNDQEVSKQMALKGEALELW